MKICQVPKCDHKHFCKGFCSTHYSRMQRGKDPYQDTQYDKAPIQRFWEKVEKTNYCWEWLSTKNSKGYGQFSPDRNVVKAHRWIWEYENGVIPENLTIDHFECNNSSCVNVSHMELVTREENTKRARALRNKNGGGNTILYTIGDKTQSIKDWCREYDIHYETIRSRMSRGLSLEESLTRPLSRIGNGR